MTAAQLILLVIRVSIVLTVFSLALHVTPRDVTYLFRRTGLLVRSVLAMNVIMPLFAAALATLFELHPALKIALVALAVSPVPPLLPKKQVKAGGTTSYIASLLAVAALLAIFFVPLAVNLLGRVFMTHAHVPPASVATVVLTTVLAPLAAGVVVRAMMPTLAEKLAAPLGLFATILLALGALVMLFAAWPQVVSLVGNGTLVAITVFVLFGLAVGHLLGGPEPDDRTVLAIATASRHPGVAIAIAAATFPQEKAVSAAVVLYLIVSAIVSIPYASWRKREHGAAASA